MKPDDIRKLFHSETAATDAEAAQFAADARTDPEVARALIQTLYAMASEDQASSLLLHMFLESMTMWLIAERAAESDDFALKCGELIVDGMQRMGRTARGRPKRTTKSA